MFTQALTGTDSNKKPSVFLKVQGVLHSTDSVALPCSLLLAAALTFLYQHLTDPSTGRHSTKNFLAKMVLSMVCLAVLERKILRCEDPVGLFAKCSAKVLLMHGCFIALRLGGYLVLPDVEAGEAVFHIVALVGACALLPTVFGFRFSKAGLMEHRDVAGLALCAVVVAFLEVSLLGLFSFSNLQTRSLFIEDVTTTGSDYIELLSFVPAVWMACRDGRGTPQYELADSQWRAACLFAFLTAFYSVEDVAGAIGAWKDSPTVSCGYVAHFLLLMDFSAFVLAHLYDPEKFAKIRGMLLAMISDACAV